MTNPFEPPASSIASLGYEILIPLDATKECFVILLNGKTISDCFANADEAWQWAKNHAAQAELDGIVAGYSNPFEVVRNVR